MNIGLILDKSDVLSNKYIYETFSGFKESVNIYTTAPVIKQMENIFTFEVSQKTETIDLVEFKFLVHTCRKYSTKFITIPSYFLLKFMHLDIIYTSDSKILERYQIYEVSTKIFEGTWQHQQSLI